MIETIEHRFPGVRLALDGDPEAIVLVAGGEPSLRRMLFNLLVNACEGDGGHAATNVRLEVAREPREVTIEISDDGPGFDEAVVASERPGATTKRHGTGLGLPIACAIVRASGGALELANSDGGGARVRIELAAAIGFESRERTKRATLARRATTGPD